MAALPRVPARLDRIFAHALRRCGSVTCTRCSSRSPNYPGSPTGVGVFATELGARVERVCDLREIRSGLDGWMLPCRTDGPPVRSALDSWYHVCEPRVR